jgi:tRNA U34 5-methylaminomethyl-2-thiouridine-forming methyltransferase MnmC
MKRQVIRTADGSSTIRMVEMAENYHSTRGAIQESRHVFINQGLHYVQDKDPVRIFELGFGTGLNALLALGYAMEKGIQVHYTGIEAYPLEEDLISQLNYTNHFSEEIKGMFSQMHAVTWGEDVQLSPFFQFKKVYERIEYWTETGTFDLIFFDAFGPRSQGELWSLDILRKMQHLLLPGGVFVTYCAKGQLKRDLRYLGFEVQSIEGPPGKREMTRAIKL